MTEAAQPSQTLDGLLDELERTVDREPAAAVRQLHEAIGERSFGPLLCAVGLAGVTPLSAVPTVPSMLALCTVLVAVQLVFGRKTFWLPKWLLDRRISRGRLRSSVRLARRPARVVDRLLKPRLEALTGSLASRLVALVCIMIAATVPVLELLPLVAGLPSLAILAFGLGLLARDGLLVVLALAVSGGALFAVGQHLLG